MESISTVSSTEAVVDAEAKNANGEEEGNDGSQVVVKATVHLNNSCFFSSLLLISIKQNLSYFH